MVHNNFKLQTGGAMNKKRGTIFSVSMLLFAILIPFSVFGSNEWKEAAVLAADNNENQTVMVRVQDQGDTRIELEYTVPAPTFTPIDDQSVRGESTEKCILGNAWFFSEPGKPVIPEVVSRVFLPPGHTISHIELIPKETINLDGEHLLAYGEILHPIGATTITRAKADPAVYESNTAYPEHNSRVVTVQNRCGVTIASVASYPVTYYPKTRKILYHKQFSVIVHTKLDTEYQGDIRVRLQRIYEDGILEENPEMLNRYTDGALSGRYQNKLCNPADEFTYVAITNKEIIEATTSPNFNDLILHRKSMGFSCKVQDIAEVLSVYSGRDNPEKLRNFIKDAYNNWNTKYVLLGGDINIIPLRTVQASAVGEVDNVPTDLPYQCLNQSSWNNDYEGELYIGRISAENPEEFSNIVYKILRYENDYSSSAYLKNVLGVGEKLNENGDYGKSCMLKVNQSFTSSFSHQGLYDKDSEWSESELINKLNTNTFGIVNHLGHSNYDYVMKLLSGVTFFPETFTNSNPFFVYSQGCIPGAFDRNCIGEQFTTSYKYGGSWGLVFNSRYGLYQPGNVLQGPSQHLHVSFWDACFKQNKKYFSEFNEYSHRVNSSKIASNSGFRWVILVSNYLSDPGVKMRAVSADNYVRIVSPNGNEKWEQGRKQTIRWDSNIQGNVKIELLSNGSVEKVIAESATGNGSYEWSIPNDCAVKDNYKIRITSSSGSVKDESEENFAIEKKTELTLKSPTSGPIVEGSETAITWDYSGDGNVRVDLYMGDDPILAICEKSGRSGSYTWKVPTYFNSSKKYSIRISAIDKPWLVSESSKDLTFTNPVVMNYPYTVNFDELKPLAPFISGHWEQETSDDLDWLSNSGPTGSAGTGPETDHTTNSKEGAYLYVEASMKSNKQTHIISPEFDLGSVKNAKFSFWLHMFADTSASGLMGDLCVDIKEGSSWKNDILKVSDKQGSAWKEKTIDLSEYEGKKIQIRFRGIVGPTRLSDIAIDDIKLDGEVTNHAPAFTSTPVTDAKVGEEYSYDIKAEDSDADKLEIKCTSNLPDWLKFNDNGNGTALLKGTPENASDAGTFTVTLTVTDNKISSPVKSEFQVTVAQMDKPEITEDPDNKTVDEGGKVTFTVEAKGYQLKYQWQKNGNDISNATGNKYTIEKVSKDDNGAKFRCKVKNAGGEVTSQEAQLTVKTTPIIHKKDPITPLSSSSIVTDCNPVPVTNGSVKFLISSPIPVVNATISVFDQVGNCVYRNQFKQLTVKPYVLNPVCEWDFGKETDKSYAGNTYVVVLKIEDTVTKDTKQFKYTFGIKK